MNFGDFFLPQKSLKMRDVLEKMRECGKLPNLRDFPHDCGMVDTYVKAYILFLISILHVGKPRDTNMGGIHEWGHNL